MIPLFEHYPLLARKLPYVALGEFPTPVQKLDQMGRQLGLESLYIKRDDISSKAYGGNKIRKLEFVLGEALHARAKEVLTFGAAGSNHALATAIYAKKLGLKSISMLVTQPNAQYVRRNLLKSYQCGAELHSYPRIPYIKSLINPCVLYQIFRHWLKSGRLPRIITMGGSSSTGTAGFVNAAFELKGQILREEIPEPDYIYVPSGSMGTAAGLILGLRAINSKTKVVAIRVNSENVVNARGMVNLIRQTNNLLSSLDPSFPRLQFSEADMDIRHDYFGKRYALFTPEGMEAVSFAEKYAGIKLEGTYTGKAFAALINDANKLELRNKVLLFWNTHNSRDYSQIIDNIDYKQLPRCFYPYFEDEVQALDSDRQN
jgi:1-aminocyclopropane-1-carboxylate deaminase/D-cysteine desulfhydrase-like pyridoxal-dependent ACC family enzyme